MLNRSMSFMSSIPAASARARPSHFEEDFDKLLNDGAQTERRTEPVSIEKKYTFKVKVEEPKEEEEVGNMRECFKCQGSGQNKRGKACKKCSGKGQINHKFYDDLSTMLENEVKSYCQNEAKNLYKAYLQKKKVEQSKINHHIPCCECKENIVGIRYKCTQRADFDICERCEDNHGENHQYSFIKIRKPEMAPVHLVCQYGNNNQIPEGYEVELRHAPVQEPKEELRKS